jgi:hypothetical protein
MALAVAVGEARSEGGGFKFLKIVWHFAFCNLNDETRRAKAEINNATIIAKKARNSKIF